MVVGVLVKKRKMKEKGEGKVFIGFGFVKVMQINKREGAICKVEDEVFLLANGGLPW